MNNPENHKPEKVEPEKTEAELSEDELDQVNGGGSFTYGKIEWTYTPQNTAGTPLPQVQDKK